MKEHERQEVVLTIRNDGQGIDLHVGPVISDMSQRVLRALQLGGPHLVVGVDMAQPGADRAVVHEPAPQQDDEELVEELARMAFETPTSDDPPERYVWRDDLTPLGRENCRIEVRAVLAHLRAKGLMRTPADVRAIEHMKVAEIRANEAEHQLEVSKAQVKALTQKAEEANRMFEAELSKTSRLSQDLATTEQAYQREQAARKEAEAALATAARLPNEGRIVTQTDWDQRFTCLAAAERRAGEEHVARVEAQEAVRLAEKRAHEAGQEVARLSTELLEAQRMLAVLEAKG